MSSPLFSCGELFSFAIAANESGIASDSFFQNRPLFCCQLHRLNFFPFLSAQELKSDFLFDSFRKFSFLLFSSSNGRERLRSQTDSSQKAEKTGTESLRKANEALCTNCRESKGKIRRMIEKPAFTDANCWIRPSLPNGAFDFRRFLHYILKIRQTEKRDPSSEQKSHLPSGMEVRKIHTFQAKL